MKKNTQKILLALYSSSDAIKNRVPSDYLCELVPDLSDGGFRSLLHVLKNKGLVSTHRALGKTTVSITQQATLLIEAEFPALSSKWDTWNGEWDCMVFRESPKLDKQFRYLRKVLISQGALPVNRGVYLAPGGFSDAAITECQNSYQSNVLIFSVGAWKMAAESAFVIEKYGLLDLAEAYSGISNDVSRLIKMTAGRKRLTSSDKKQISLVYDRVIAVLIEDPGFCTFYFNEVENLKSALLRLNGLISL